MSHVVSVVCCSLFLLRSFLSVSGSPFASGYRRATVASGHPEWFAWENVTRPPLPKDSRYTVGS